MRPDLSFRFDLWYARLPRSPVGVGRVELLVRRPAGGTRDTPDRVRLDPEVGVVGDRWSADPQRDPQAQVSLMNVHVVRSLEPDPTRWSLFGDNLLVDLDLEERNLPVGSLLRVGGALIEVTPALHRPCAKFVERFGATAAKKVARAGRRGRRARGVMCRVLEGGEVQVGDELRIVGGD